MRALRLLRVLRSTAAVGAIALGSTTAHAACTTANGVVTCTGANTTNDVSNAVDRTPPPPVTIAIAEGATVTRGFSNAIYVSGQRSGAIGYINSGVVGTPGANVDFQFNANINDSGNPANTFTLDNRGTQNGRISAFGVGGAISGTNSGTVTGGIDLRGAGAINFTNTGRISNSFGFSDAVSLSSFLTTSQTDADGTTRSTSTGGPVTATLGGVIGFSAGGFNPGTPQSVSAGSVAGVDITANGIAGLVAASSSGNATTSRYSFVPSGPTSTVTQVYDSNSIGANARVTVGSAAQLTGVSVRTDAGTATAIVNGTVGSASASNGVYVSANGVNSTSRYDQVNGTTSNTSTSSSSNTLTGEAVLAEVSATGRVIGGVTAQSNAGAAAVRIAGQVGSAATFGSVASSSTGTNSTNQSRSFNQYNASSYESGNSSTGAVTGGAALTTIAATGDVFGSASAQGDGSAVVDNAGRIRGSVTATSGYQYGSTLTVSANNSAQSTTTASGGVVTTVNTNASNSTYENLGGMASITNRLGAAIDGSAQATGARGASLDNAGTIAGSVYLSSTGTGSTYANTNRSTTTNVPAAGGGTTSTSVTNSTSTTSTRATGGAVTGTYNGTVGSAPLPDFSNFAYVQQSGTSASTATVAGTLFADFYGSAGGENRDSTTTSSSNQVTQANGAYTRDQASSSRDTVSQIASTSTLTVTASGRIAGNGNGNGSGNVTLTSSGGDARLTLDGGQIAGDVFINAGTGVNSTRTSNSSTSFTRAASPLGTFVSEVQQGGTNAMSMDSRQAPGTGIATVNAGTIGGDLTVSGNGSGPGSLGANVLMNGTVTGALNASSSGVNSRTDTSSSIVSTAPNAFTRTVVNNSVSAPSENAGGVLVTLGGTVGSGLVAGTDTGNARVDLAGSVGSVVRDGATVLSYDSTSPRQITTISTGTTAFNLVPTSSTNTSSFTLSGGLATLNVAPNAGIRAAGTSSVEGDVIIQGFAGSTLNLAAGSRIVQTSGAVTVGAAFANSTSNVTTSFTNGVQTGSVTTSTSTAVGGPAVLTNAGTIGSAANNSAVLVTSVGGASVTNTGTVNGSIMAVARGANRTTTSTGTNLNSAANRRIVASNALTAVGGTAEVTNAALVTGDITAIGATGTVTNAGVVRGGVTLGGGFSNFTTTTTTTTSAAGTTTVNDPSVANASFFAQRYTLDQNGVLLRGVTVTGATTIDPSGAAVRTGNVNATVNLNNGSITLGNITADVNTGTAVNLNGAGFLGVAANDATGPAVNGSIVTGYQPTPSLARFAAIDPALGSTVATPAGSRVSGVQTLTKTGDGTFVINGAPLLAATGTASPTYTLDVGTLRVGGGELQLGLAGATATANTFGIRGSVENGANLVIGRRITDGMRTAIQGINVSVVGNVTNAVAGNLIVGVNPTLVRASAAAPGASPFATAPLPFVPFGSVSGIPSTNSFVRVDGNLTLAGTVAVQGTPGGLYDAGQAYDLFSVSGAYANTGTVRANFASPFVSFTLTPRSEGGRTVVSLGVVRTDYATGATDANARAAAGALQATLPSVFAGVRSGTNTGNVQDLANIVSALDTQLSADQAGEVFRELSSGEVYGSLAAVSTTAPFGDATDGFATSGTASGAGLWFRPTGQFASYLANANSGASQIDVNNHGGSLGLNYATGNGGNVGIAGGYGRLRVRADTPERADADTYMVGIYAAQQLGRLQLSSQAVYGRSKWDASRAMPLLNRTATSRFNSNEVRVNLRVAYTLAMLPDFDISPFAKVEARRYDFDGFTEQGAGAVSLAVGGRKKTVVSPEVGLRMSGALASKVRPFAEASYIFQGDVGGTRSERFVGGAGNFVVEGVDPASSIKGAIGVAADVGNGTLFLRGDYSSGGRQQVGSVRGGLLFTF
jgi:hypothetical protein